MVFGFWLLCLSFGFVFLIFWLRGLVDFCLPVGFYWLWCLMRVRSLGLCLRGFVRLGFDGDGCLSLHCVCCCVSFVVSFDFIYVITLGIYMVVCALI